MTIDRALELQARAWTLQAEGNLDDAFAACHEALLLTEQCEGSDSADVANLLNDLAEIECDRQKFQAALTYSERDRKSTRLNSSHSQISYAVFCLKKKKPCLLCGVRYLQLLPVSSPPAGVLMSARRWTLMVGRCLLSRRTAPRCLHP